MTIPRPSHIYLNSSSVFQVFKKQMLYLVGPRSFIFFFYFLVTLQSSFVYSQTVRYEISFDNAVHHEARIRATFSGLAEGPLEAVMSRSSPGRYALHEFAKHVYEVQATNSKGESIPIIRATPHEWHIRGHDGTVNLTYTLFGNRADGTYTGINARFAHLNIPATFMWARGLEERPIEVIFRLPEGKNWKVATQLKTQTQSNVFAAPNMQYFMDSPIIVGDYMLRTWQVQDKGQPKTIQLAVLHEGSEEEADEYATQLKKVVQEQQAIFGELPAFDFGRYTFLASYSPYVAGDGMEHRNSTILTGPYPLKTAFSRYLGTASHEFFHAWNVERIRPKSLEPFNFERANMSGELWFAEGFTNYYGHLTLARTGAKSIEEYTRELGSTLNYVLNAPGRQVHSAIEMSQQAPFVDAAVSIEPNNRANTYLSYYVFGEMIAVALDLSLRKNFKNKTLDEYMRQVWQKYGKTEKPYTIDDLQTTLTEMTSPAFANSFFEQYIRGKQAAPYKELLAQAGILLRKTNPEKASIGDINFTYSDAGASIASPVLRGTPLYAAGLTMGDIITHIGGQKADKQLINNLLKNQKPGDKLFISFLQMGETKQATLTLAADNQVELILFENAGQPVTKAIESFRNSWLGSQVRGKQN